MTSPFKTANNVIMEALKEEKRSENDPKHTIPKNAYPSNMGRTPTINLATRGTPRFNVATKI